MDKFNYNQSNMFNSKTTSSKNAVFFPGQLNLSVHVPKVKSLKGLIYKSVNVKHWFNYDSFNKKTFKLIIIYRRDSFDEVKKFKQYIDIIMDCNDLRERIF